MRPRDLWQVWRRMGPYRRSHHPLCGPFRADVLVVRGQRYCIACYVGYPALAVALVAGLLAFDAAGAPWWAWCAAGLVAATPQALSFAGRVPDWRAQLAVKLALGLGFGAFAAGLLSAPWALWVRAVAVVLAFYALNALWLLRFHRLERTCQACPQNPLRPGCEGLRELDGRVGHLVCLPKGAQAGDWERIG